MLTVFYVLIHPTPALRARCSDEDELSTIVWTVSLSGRGFDSMQDVVDGIKLLFIAEQLSGSRLENSILKLGIDALGVSQFDHFWKLELVAGPCDKVEEILNSYRDSDFVSSLKDSGNSFLVHRLD